MFATLVLIFQWIIFARWDCQSEAEDSQVPVTVGMTDPTIKRLRLINLIQLPSLYVKSLSKDWTASVVEENNSCV